MHPVLRLLTERMSALELTQKDLAHRWLETATAKGKRFSLNTVTTELSRLLRGNFRGQRFFLAHDRVGITAVALGWTLERFAEAAIFAGPVGLRSVVGGER